MHSGRYFFTPKIATHTTVGKQNRNAVELREISSSPLRSSLADFINQREAVFLDPSKQFRRFDTIHELKNNN